MITKLYYFIKVASLGSFTKAAKDLYITQPALSLAIKRLEKDLGIQLFEREGNRTVLSPDGEKILPYAEAIYSNYLSLKSVISLNAETQSIKLGSGMSHVAEIIDEHMDDFSASHIKAILIQYYNYYDLRVALLERKVDVAICSPPIVGTDIISKDLFTEPICALMNKSHPLANTAVLSYKDILNEPLIALPTNNPRRLSVDLAFASVGAKPQYSHEVDSIAIIPMLMREDSRLLTLFPLSRARAVHLSNGLVYKPFLEKDFVRTISISWHKRSSCTHSIEKIIDFSEEYYASSPLFQNWGAFPLEKQTEETFL